MPTTSISRAAEQRAPRGHAPLADWLTDRPGFNKHLHVRHFGQEEASGDCEILRHQKHAAHDADPPEVAQLGRCPLTPQQGREQQQRCQTWARPNQGLSEGVAVPEDSDGDGTDRAGQYLQSAAAFCELLSLLSHTSDETTDRFLHTSNVSRPANPWPRSNTWRCTEITYCYHGDGNPFAVAVHWDRATTSTGSDVRVGTRNADAEIESIRGRARGGRAHPTCTRTATRVLTRVPYIYYVSNVDQNLGLSARDRKSQ